MALRIVSPLPIHPLQQNPLLRRRRLSPSLPLSAGARLTAATFAEAEEQPIPSIPLDGDDTLLVQELEELPEQWRRSKVAWLCKQLPGQKPGALTRLLNAQRKWISQQDVTYLVVHCLRIRENDSAFKVYTWMRAQPKFHFDFALADRLTECLGKDKKYLKCREIFEEIMRQGRVPSESTFQNLASAYLTAVSYAPSCLDEACIIYNKMIEIGGYDPRLSLHNALFRAIAIKTSFSGRDLDQAEFIFSNIANRGVQIQKDVYGGLIRIHSHQELVDMDRITALRDEMLRIGGADDVDVLIDLLRACSKVGDVQEADRVWEKILERGAAPLQAFIYRMEVHAKVRDPMRCLEIFRSIKDHGISANSSAYDKIIEIMARSGEIELAEEILRELVNSSLKPAASSFLSIMNMYIGSNSYEKIEILFDLCRSKIEPSRGVFSVYLNSLARSGNLKKAEEIFNKMETDPEIGINVSSCNAILGLFLASEDFFKAEKIYRLMSQKNFEIDPALDRILALKNKKKIVDKKTAMPKLDVEQREILIGLLLGGLRLELSELSRNYSIHFDFSLDNPVHHILGKSINYRFREWLLPSSSVEEVSNLVREFSTVPHWSFNFFAEKFRPRGRPAIPLLINRWLSDRALAYWYMYGGIRSSKGDILLKMKGGGVDEEVQRIIMGLQAKSMGCRVKKKGRTAWIGLRGADAARFWELTEGYVLEGAREYLNPAMVTVELDRRNDSDEDGSVGEV